MSSRAADKRADALRAADLVRRERHEIGAERIDIAGDAPGRLHRVDMQQAARRMHDGGRFGDRLHDAGLIVGEHDRNQRPAALRQRFCERRKIRAAHRRRPEDPRSRRAGNRPPARTEECSIAEIKSRSRGRFSSAVSIAGVSASMLASVPLDVKNHVRRLARRPVPPLARAPARPGAAPPVPRRAPRTDCRRTASASAQRRGASAAAAAPWRSNRDRCAPPLTIEVNGLTGF